MLEWNGLVLTLAQETDRPGGDTGGSNNGGGGGNNAGEGQDGSPGGQNNNNDAAPGGIDPIFIMLMLFLVIMVGMTIFSQRREKKKRKALIESVGKNDRVVTIGGIIGTVVEIRDNEITLKVDESSNTRMRFSKSAIQGVVGQED